MLEQYAQASSFKKTEALYLRH